MSWLAEVWQSDVEFSEPGREEEVDRWRCPRDHKGRDHGGPPVRLSSCELGRLWMMRGSSLGRGSWVSGLV
jgi:hypothetical protein